MSAKQRLAEDRCESDSVPDNSIQVVHAMIQVEVFSAGGEAGALNVPRANPL